MTEEHREPVNGDVAHEPGADTVPPKRPRGRWYRVLRALLVLFLAYYVFCVLLLVVYRFVRPPVTAVQVQRRIEALVKRTEYEPRKTWRSLESMSRHVPRAVVVAEDGRFWNHWGFDLVELRNAGMEAIDRGRLRGASTITQQLMKNLFGCACRFPLRKVYDLALTPAAELILPKERIMELYLNEVEWGKGIWGVEAAARHHYDRSAARLSRTQAAGLAALLPAPRVRTPRNTPQYRAEIVRRMRFRGW